MCTYGIYHTSNGYYSAVVEIRTILCLIQVRDKPTEAYYRICETSISTADLTKCNTTTHMEINKSYANGDNGDGTKIFQEMCLTMSTNLYQYSGIWNDLKNSTLLGTDNYPKTTTFAYNLLCHYKKPASPYQLHAPPEEVTFIQSGDTYKNNTTPVNDGRSFPEVA